MPSVASFSRLGKHALALSAAVAASLILLSACSSGKLPEQVFAPYQAQLSQVLEQQPLPVTPKPMPVMPRANTLRSPIEEASISLLDSMRLDRCRAGALIAERNSALGRLRSPSARLHYEIDLMQALHECRQSAVADNERLDAAMAEAIAHKKEVLPQWIARVLTNSEEFRHALRAHSAPLTQHSHSDAQASLNALAYLTDTFELLVTDPTTEVDLESYKLHFRTLHQSDYLPRFWRSQQQAAAWMQSLNQQLDKGIQNATCPDPEKLQEAHQHYQQNIEPLLSEWQNTNNQLKMYLLRLRDLSSAESWQNYLDALAGQSSHAQNLNKKTQVHKQAWNALLARDCSSSK